MTRFHAPLWSHNERPIEDRSDRIKFEYSREGPQTSRIEKMIIEHVRPQDTGFYRCSSVSRKAHFVKVIALSSPFGKEANGDPDRITIFQVLEHDNIDIEIDCKLPISNEKAPVYW